MSDGKKDILEMDFGKLSIPQAIGITLQATTKCVSIEDMTWNDLEVDNDRVAELMEKLEARVQDALDEKDAPVKEKLLEEIDEENVDWSDVVLLEDGAIANIKGAVYAKLCNEPVYENNEKRTYCMKQWAHVSVQHEDLYGWVR